MKALFMSLYAVAALTIVTVITLGATVAIITALIVLAG